MKYSCHKVGRSGGAQIITVCAPKLQSNIETQRFGKFDPVKRCGLPRDDDGG